MLGFWGTLEIQVGILQMGSAQPCGVSCRSTKKEPFEVNKLFETAQPVSILKHPSGRPALLVTRWLPFCLIFLSQLYLSTGHPVNPCTLRHRIWMHAFIDWCAELCLSFFEHLLMYYDVFMLSSLIIHLYVDLV